MGSCEIIFLAEARYLLHAIQLVKNKRGHSPRDNRRQFPSLEIKDLESAACQLSAKTNPVLAMLLRPVCFFCLFFAVGLLLLSHLDVHTAAASAAISQASAFIHLVMLMACWSPEGCSSSRIPPGISQTCSELTKNALTVFSANSKAAFY